MENYKSRIKEFEDVIADDVIDVKKLKKLCFHGIPDESGLRGICWRLMLQYLPPERTTWPSYLEKQRLEYEQFVNDMVIKPTDSQPSHAAVEDHPLSLNPESKWQTYFKDNEVLLQIDKDVRRLCPEICFFQRATSFPCTSIVENTVVERLNQRVEASALKSEHVTRKGLGVMRISHPKKSQTEEYSPLSQGQEAHWEVVERILFIYAKLNPGQGYVQGMNEILGPIYHTFATDSKEEWRANAEADSFYCFTNLMSEIRDFFIKTLDESESGIFRMMHRLVNRLDRLDRDLSEHLRELRLLPQFYSFRWIIVLLSQEFPLPDVERVWDSLFADEERFDFLITVCSAMIILLKDRLMDGDFSSNMKLLQNFPASDIHLVLDKALELRESIKRKKSWILGSQTVKRLLGIRRSKNVPRSWQLES